MSWVLRRSVQVRVLGWSNNGFDPPRWARACTNRHTHLCMMMSMYPCQIMSTESRYAVSIAWVYHDFFASYTHVRNLEVGETLQFIQRCAIYSWKNSLLGATLRPPRSDWSLLFLRPFPHRRDDRSRHWTSLRLGWWVWAAKENIGNLALQALPRPHFQFYSVIVQEWTLPRYRKDMNEEIKSKI